MTTVSNNPSHDTSQCVFCLEPIQEHVITIHFTCGCQMTIHKECHTQLMEEGHLKYCWYCQRDLWNQHEQHDTRSNLPLFVMYCLCILFIGIVYIFLII